MSRGISTVQHIKGLHKKYCSLHSVTIAKNCATVGRTASTLSPIACINGIDNELYKVSRHNNNYSPYFVFDLRFVRNLSIGQRRFEAAGGPPPSPPDGPSNAGNTASGEGGGNDDRLVCPKCGSPCQGVNAFVAATRYV